MGSQGCPRVQVYMLWGEGWRHPQVPAGDAGVEVGVWLPGIIDAVVCKSHTASSVTVGTSLCTVSHNQCCCRWRRVVAQGCIPVQLLRLKESGEGTSATPPQSSTVGLSLSCIGCHTLRTMGSHPARSWKRLLAWTECECLQVPWAAPRICLCSCSTVRRSRCSNALWRRTTAQSCIEPASVLGLELLQWDGKGK